MIIEVCGPGCPRCHAVKENVRKVVEEMEVKLGQDVTIIEVKDPKMMAARRVFMTPGVVIDGVKVCEGRIPDMKEIRGWIEERL